MYLPPPPSGRAYARREGGFRADWLRKNLCMVFSGMVEMTSDPAYSESAIHRIAGLEGQLNIETKVS